MIRRLKRQNSLLATTWLIRMKSLRVKPEALFYVKMLGKMCIFALLLNKT